MIDKIISSIREIGKWTSKNGFSNRGRHTISYYADELEKAERIVTLAYRTLERCENAYMHFYIEKTMEMHPELTKRFEKLWERVHNGWADHSELVHLYGGCVLNNPELEALPEMLTDLITYGKVK